jgi:hypothetical protein
MDFSIRLFLFDASAQIGEPWFLFGVSAGLGQGNSVYFY